MAYAPPYSGVTWTVAELLDEVRDEARIDTSDFADAKILAFADQAIRSTMSEPEVTNSAISGRVLDYHDELVSNGLRSGSEYWVPNSSASGSVSHVDYYDREDAEPSRLEYVEPAQAHYIAAWDTNEGDPSHFTFRDGRVVLVPAPRSPGSTARVRIYFPRAHPKLVVTEDNVSPTLEYAASTNRVVITSTTLPGNWGAAPFRIDIYSQFSPHTPLCRGLEISAFVESAGGTALTFVDPVVAGDLDDLEAMNGTTSPFLVALSGTSDCVQLPGSMRKGLTALTAAYILQTLGEVNQVNRLLGLSQKEILGAQNQMQPRSKASAPKIVPRSGLRRRGTFGRWGGW